MKKQKLSIYLLLAVVLLTCAVFAGTKIIQINKKYPQVVKVDVQKNDTAELQDEVTMEVIKAEMFSMEEAEARYSQDFINEMGTDYPFKTVEVTIELENQSEEEKEVALYDIYLEKEDYSNGLAPEVFFEIGNETDYIVLEAKEVREVTLGYLIYKMHFYAGEWEKMNVEDFFLAEDRYPEKIRWRM